MTTRILLADDQELVRNGFRLILDVEPDIEVVGEVGDGAAAVTAATDLHPDVILMDIRMPILDGIRATEQITALGAPTGHPPRVLILTTFDQDQNVYDALRAGASGFLLKDARRDQLIEAIGIVARGEQLFAPTILQRLVETFVQRAAPTPIASPGIGRLTEREHEVLILLARGFTNHEIAQNLVVTDATAKTHVARILQKLSLRDRTQAVILAYENGLIHAGVPGDELHALEDRP